MYYIIDYYGTEYERTVDGETKLVGLVECAKYIAPDGSNIEVFEGTQAKAIKHFKLTERKRERGN